MTDIYVTTEPREQLAVTREQAEPVPGTCLHTVDVVVDKDTGEPRIIFTCSGDQGAECHLYPVLECGDPNCDGENPDCPDHPVMPQWACWAQDWFDNDHIEPSVTNFAESDLRPGMSGPISFFHQEYYLEWSFRPVAPSTTGVAR